MATVLIVEDDHDLRRLFRAALAFAGHNVIEASDGLTALHLLDGRRPDLVILDLGLPVISGHVVRAELAAADDLGQIPILVVTGDNIKSIEPPVACLLHKPVSPEQLVRAADRCLASGARPPGSATSATGESTGENQSGWNDGNEPISSRPGDR